GGMTCASCAARVERKLNRLDGVQASVNFATEQARVQAPEGVGVDELIAAVSATGYTATPSAPLGVAGPADGASSPPGPSLPASAPPPAGVSPAADGSADGSVASQTDPHAAELATLRTRLIASAVLAVPVMVLSMVPALQFT